MKNHWNRQSRKSGGARRTIFSTAPISAEDVAILLQEQAIRKEFGEEGVRRFYEELENKVKTEAQS